MAFTTKQEIDSFGDKITVEHGFKFNVDGTRAKWTGWKYGGWDTYSIDHPVRDWDEGFCAQLVWYRYGDDPSLERGWKKILYGYYVNMPGMQCGRFVKGACFDIGDQRVRESTPPSEIDAMIEAGWKQLIELVQREEGVDISSLREV
jgi:hypothetical protein